MTYYQDHVFWQQRVQREQSDFRKNLDVRLGLSPKHYINTGPDFPPEKL